MKNIKKFEELNLSTYRNAASKLANIKHVKRSDRITQYADKIEADEKERKERIEAERIEKRKNDITENYIKLQSELSVNGLYNISKYDYGTKLKNIPKAYIGIGFDSYNAISWFNECKDDDDDNDVYYSSGCSCSFYIQVIDSLDFDFDRDSKISEYYCDFIIHFDFSKDIIDFNDFSLENFNLKDRASAGRFLSYLKRFVSTSAEVKKFESYLESKGYKYTSILNYIKRLNPNKLYIE